VFAAIAAVALCVAFSPKLGSVTFVPKAAILLLFAAAGVVPLVRMVRSSTPLRWPARACVAFLAVALVSALASPSPNLGFFGLYLWGTGWLFWLGAAGAFAIGASFGAEDRRLLFGGLLVGAVANALWAVFQIIVNSPTPGLALYPSLQADGFLGNPIYLEALLLGALALILGRACRAPLRWGAVVVLLAVGLEFSFERVAPVVIVLLVLYAAYSYGIRRAGVFALLAGTGYGIAYAGGGSLLGSRVAAVSGQTTFGVRIRMWIQGARYVVHHPLLGAGPGQLRSAMDSSATLGFYQHVLAGRVLTDAHDIFVEVAVTTGLLGLALFAVWVLGAARLGARGGFLGFAAAAIAVELVEPIDVAILPLALLALGAATAQRLKPAVSTGAEAPPEAQVAPAEVPATRRVSPSLSVITTSVAVMAALFLGVTMVAGDAYMFRGTNSGSGRPFNLGAAGEANRLLPYWPDPALELAQNNAYYSLNDSKGVNYLAAARNWTAVAANRDVRSPYDWTLLGDADLAVNSYGRARTDYLRALSCDRWFTQALQGLGQVDAAHHDWGGAIDYYKRALVTVPYTAKLKQPLQLLLARAEKASRSGHS
jgi:tetratricopeptide (TPR) repeat protein